MPVRPPPRTPTAPPPVGPLLFLGPLCAYHRTRQSEGGAAAYPGPCQPSTTSKCQGRPGPPRSTWPTDSSTYRCDSRSAQLLALSWCCCCSCCGVCVLVNCPCVQCGDLKSLNFRSFNHCCVCGGRGGESSEPLQGVSVCFRIVAIPCPAVPTTSPGVLLLPPPLSVPDMRIICA